MTTDFTSRRVLVIDDVEQMRVIIRRALAGCGYEVDVAATLVEARRLNPAGYDAVLIDVALGPERGTDLLAALRAEDPAAARRCLLMTGGSTDAIPDGVASLVKPFRLADLIDAVRSLEPRDPAAGAAARGAQAPAEPPPRQQAPGWQATGWQAPGQQAPGWQALALGRRLRARDRHQVADFLHDGPVQDLTAATLDLQLMGRQLAAGSGPPWEKLQERLDSAAGSLRWLIDAWPPSITRESGLVRVLQQQTAALLAEPIIVDPPEQQPDLAPGEVLAIADIVELLLLDLLPGDAPARASARVDAQDSLIRLELTVTPASADDPPGDPAGDLADGDPAAVRAALAGLDRALGTRADAEFRDRSWHVRMDLPRPAPGPAAG